MCSVIKSSTKETKTRLDLIPQYPEVSKIAVSVEEGMLADRHRITSTYYGKGIPVDIPCGNWRCRGGRLPLFAIAFAVVHALTHKRQERDELRVMCSGSEPVGGQEPRPCVYCYRITVSLVYKAPS